MKTLVELNPSQNVRGMSKIMGVSISAILDHTKKIGKLEKMINWFHITSFKVKVFDF